MSDSTDQVGISTPAVAPQAVPEPAKGFPVQRPVRIAFARKVRWRFDYHDHKPTKVGQWCRPGDGPADMAVYQSKENLRVASIEVKEAITGKTYVIAECDGKDFCNFEWVAGAPVGAVLGGKLKGERQLGHQIIGLTLVTRDLRATVMIDGSTPSVEHRSEDEKKIHLAGYGR